MAVAPFKPVSPGFGGFQLDPASGALTLGQGGVTANPGGGQTSGVPITASVVRVTTVATTGDSLLLPAAGPGMEIAVINGGGNSLNVFPQNNGDIINALAPNTAIAIAAGKTMVFFSGSIGFWGTVLSA